MTARAARTRPRSRWGRGFSVPSVLGSGNAALSDAGMHYLLEEAHRRDATADQEFETLQQWRKCPKCGSIDRYTQRRAS
ncbi:MAG: hypothetical protein J2P35_03355 [Actinobacteria bacterium]|nr:hypothetical protein [Actinomycetota bacterium]MBO0786034.1 hypothetical protein [Actinomycetota bacterium]